MDRLIGIVRASAGLKALISYQVGSIDAALSGTETQSSALPQASCYEILERGLDASLKALIPDQVSLMETWNALARVEAFDALALSRILRVLTRTVAAETEFASSAPLPIRMAEQERPKPTAAHPRAYQGTKFQPPKLKSPPAADLRSALNTEGGTVALLERLTPFWSKAIELLHKNGCVVPEDADSFASLIQIEAHLPQVFRLSLWPLLKNEKSSVVNEYRAFYWDMGLGGHPDLLASVTRLISLQGGERTRAWCARIRQLPRGCRVAFTDCAIQTDAYQVDPAPLAGSHLDALIALLDGSHALHRLFHLLRGLKDGIAPGYLFAGFRLADRVYPDYDFQDIRHSNDYPEHSVQKLVTHLKGGEEYYDRHELHIWKRCGESPKLGRVIVAINWTRYSPDTASEYLNLYADELIHDFVADRVDLLEGHVSDVAPEYRTKFLTNLKEAFWFADNAEILAANLPFACHLLTRLARPPFKRVCNTGRVLVDFIEHLDESGRRCLLTAPDASFQRLEEACRRKNDAQLIGWGTWSLLRQAGKFSLDCFVEYPAKLFRVAKLLGCLPGEVRDEIVRAFQETPLMHENIQAMPLEEACRFLDVHSDPELTAPVTQRLREHLAGVRLLKPKQLASRQAELYRRVSLTRLAALEQATLRVLQEGFGVSARSDAVRHALQILRGTDENRHALRKFLRAYWSGDGDYLRAHPLSQGWLKRHSTINMDFWEKGLIYSSEIAARGTLQIGVEQNPLEALRLGTFVGSCLGLGGMLSYSAAAVVLDINKQVIYARDTHGTVIARQVVAISEEEQLVCFSVYPLGATDDIKGMFEEYNRRFAVALGLTLHFSEGGEDYTISTILSRGWWDDGAWEYTRK